MSSEWYQIRSADVDSASLRYTELLNKININQFSAAESELIKKPKIISETTESSVDFQDPFYVARKHGIYREFENPIEPDADRLKLWLRFAYIDSLIEDLSHMENHGVLEGNPLLCPGYNEGVVGLFLAHKWNFDRANHLDYCHIPFADSLNLLDYTTGYSFSFMFKPLSFEQHGAYDQHCFEFALDPTSDTWVALRYGTDGRLKWFVRNDADSYKSISFPNTVLTKGFYLATVNFDPLADPGEETSIFLNGEVLDIEFQGDGGGGENSDFPNDLADELYVGISGRDDIAVGAAHIIPQEIRLHAPGLSLGEHQNMWANLRSYSNIQFGKHAVPGYWWLPQLPAPPGDFDDDDWDPDDFG